MKRHEHPRFGAYAACPFCGETMKLKMVTKHLRNGDGEWPTGCYVRCLSCNARGPLMSEITTLCDKAATDAWNGGLMIERKIEGGLFE